MKKNLLFCLIFIAAFVKAQDSTYCYNSGIVSPNELDLCEEDHPFIKQQNSLILMPFVMNEKEVLMVLKEKNNSDINKLVKKFKFSKIVQGIGFAAIPEVLLGAGFIGASNATLSQNADRGVAQQNIGIGLVGLSAVCLSSSLCFKVVRTKNYKKAIAKYNQLYN